MIEGKINAAHKFVAVCQREETGKICRDFNHHRPTLVHHVASGDTVVEAGKALETKLGERDIAFEVFKLEGTFSTSTVVEEVS